MGHLKRILLADDEANLRLLVRATLETDGWQIEEASDGVTALEMATKAPPDLIVLDWMMPGLSGIEVVRALRQRPATARVPIVMLTAKGQEVDRGVGTAAGVNAYLVKPFSPLEFLERVTALLG